MKKTTLILSFTLLTLLTQFTLHSQWVQQTLPQSGTPYDMKFVNANTGWITFYSPGALFKTTNGGTNWITQTTPATDLYDIKFFNDTLGYILGYASGNKFILKTSNGGTNWNILYSTPNAFVSMHFINPDTGWVCGFDGTLGGIWRTTNACTTFQQELSSGSSSMDKIFFLNQKVNNEYTGWCSQSNIFRKTTNSGVNWFVSAPITATRQIFFINKDTGWICNSGMFKCTDGGVNWINEPMPTDPSFVFNSMNNFVYVGNNILYGVGGVRFFGGGQFRGVIWKTTNAGLNWGYLQPDTTIHIFNYSVIDFTDSSNGWAYNGTGNFGIHTTNGGGQIIYTAITQISSEIPTDFKLFQNYPNPFNPNTVISYNVKRQTSNVKLIIFDILGRVVSTLINHKQNAGTYNINFDGNGLSSGIYFYKLIADGNTIDTKKMVLMK